MSQHSLQADRRLEGLVKELEGSGGFRVLRRLVPRPPTIFREEANIRSGLFVDTETTGLDPESDKIIELAMVPFQYSLDGRILGVRRPLEALCDPGKPLPDGIIRLTGITDDMLTGMKIDVEAVAEMVAVADLIIAHNASFDRRFLEHLDASFACKPWACSMSEVNWKAEGFEGTKLAYLAMGAGFYYDRHRATNDCLAAIELLSQPLPISGRPAMSCLLEQARRNQYRIRAVDAPFAKKENLKKRGYRWSAGSALFPKAWYVDVELGARDEELSYLKREVYLGDGPVLCAEISAHDRFSNRV